MKDDPVQFVGRDIELKALTKRILRTTQPKAGVSTLPAQMLIAAPGAGKTSILTELQARLEQEGMAVIDADAEDLIDPTAFSAAVRSTPPWSDYSTAKNLGAKIAKSFDEATESLSETALQLGGSILSGGGKVAKPNIDLIERVVSVWKRNETPPLDDVLKLPDHGRAQGCIVMVDEAQDLQELTTGPKTPEGKCATKILRTLGKPKNRAKMGIERATILLAGLSDTHPVVEVLGSPGIAPQVLAPLPPSDVRKLIANAIDATSREDDTLKSLAKEAWLDLLTARYGDWTRIAQAGAEAVRQLLDEYGREAITEPWGLGAVVELGDEFRRSVYTAVITRMEKEDVSTLLRNTVSQGLFSNGNRIDRDTMRRLVGECARRDDASLSKKELRTARNEHLLRMLRAGLVDGTAHLPQVMGDTHYYCPMPSLVTHMAGNIESRKAVIEDILRSAELNS